MPDKPQCYDCVHWGYDDNKRDEREMAINGFGLCAKGDKWRFISGYSPACHKFVAAPAGTGDAHRKRHEDFWAEWRRRNRLSKENSK